MPSICCADQTCINNIQSKNLDDVTFNSCKLKKVTLAVYEVAPNTNIKKCLNWKSKPIKFREMFPAETLHPQVGD